MPWIESHQSLAQHRKLLLLCSRLSISRVEAIGHLHLLWWWALDSADDDGAVDGLTPSMLAIVGEWTNGSNVAFAEALVEAGFLEEADGEYRFHDWYAYAGRLNAGRARNRDRMRAARAAHASSTEPERVELPYRTQPTVQNQSEEDAFRVPEWAEPFEEIDTKGKLQELIAVGEGYEEVVRARAALSFADWWPHNSDGKGKRRKAPVATFTGFLKVASGEGVSRNGSKARRDRSAGGNNETWPKWGESADA
jgi:hypothetical protein